MKETTEKKCRDSISHDPHKLVKLEDVCKSYVVMIKDSENTIGNACISILLA